MIALVLVLAIFGVAGYLFWNQPHVDSTGKVHTDLYESAMDTWNPEMQVLPFRPQDIDGQTIGSSHGIRLEWSQPTETYNHFLLTVTEPVAHTSFKESGEHDRVSLDVTGLKPDTEYVFALQACVDPRCETWLVAQDEYRGRTAPEYWSDDAVPVLLNP